MKGGCQPKREGVEIKVKGVTEDKHPAVSCSYLVKQKDFFTEKKCKLLLKFGTIPTFN